MPAPLLEPFVIFVENEPIDVREVYRRRGFDVFPPTPTMSGVEIKANASPPWSPHYQLARELPDGRWEYVGDGAIPLANGQRFVGIPVGTYGGIHG